MKIKNFRFGEVKILGKNLPKGEIILQNNPHRELMAF
jgi:hypothetical protein